MFLYDVGSNMKGHLHEWRAYAPNASTPAIVDAFSDDARGRRTGTAQTLAIAGYAPLTRQLARHYIELGPVKETHYEDRVGAGTGRTTSQVHYDARGLPAEVVIYRWGSAGFTTTTTTQTRNVAGLVTNRHTVTDPATKAFVEADWRYDALGRVLGQRVQKGISGPSPTLVAGQALTYFGNDDPATMRHRLAGSERLFMYGYDHRHQLTSVATTATPAYFGAAYAYSPSGRLTQATEVHGLWALPPGSELTSRDVSYVYGGTDPEQVTALTNVVGGGTFASYTYDAAGNQRVRSFPGTGERWEYVYDGKDQLRRATKKLDEVVQGSEEYWYDGFGQRLAVVKRDASGAKTEMIWFIGDTQAHYDAAGTVTNVFAHVTVGTPVARVNRTADTTASLELTFHGLANSTLAAVAEDGTVNASFRYAPFGAVLEATDAGGEDAGIDVHKRRFNDKYQDDISGLTYYGARYYDKTLIGWTQADPLYLRVPDAAQMSTPRRANLYAFTLQNPLRYLDPDGLDPRKPTHSGDVCDPATGGQCTHNEGGTTSSVNPGRAKAQEDARAAAAQLTQGGVDMALRAPEAGSGSALGRAETVAYLAIVGFFCPGCAFVLAAGMVGHDDGTAVAGVVAAGGCSGGACVSRTGGRAAAAGGGRAALAARFGTTAERIAVLERAITAEGGLNTSTTVARQLAGQRSFIPSQSVLDTIGSGGRVADPQGVAGQFMYRSAASFNGSQGTLEVLVHEASGQIRHVLFRSGVAP